MGVSIHEGSGQNAEWRRLIREEIAKRERELAAAKAVPHDGGTVIAPKPQG